MHSCARSSNAGPEDPRPSLLVLRVGCSCRHVALSAPSWIKASTSRKHTAMCRSNSYECDARRRNLTQQHNIRPNNAVWLCVRRHLKRQPGEQTMVQKATKCACDNSIRDQQTVQYIAQCAQLPAQVYPWGMRLQESVCIPQCCNKVDCSEGCICRQHAHCQPARYAAQPVVHRGSKHLLAAATDSLKCCNSCQLTV